MAFEIDYIPVGNGESSGDAIALRYGNLSGPREEQTIVVIDGGYKESGEALVQHINKYYGTNLVNMAISTHPDADHASGLAVVLEKCKVNQLLMHKPWNHAQDIKNMFFDGRITASGPEERLEKSLQDASDLEKLANKNGIEILEPFQGVGTSDGSMRILGPSLELYESLLLSFKPCPESKGLDIASLFKQVALKVDEWVEDNLGIDLLDDDNDQTSAENNTSTIVLFTIEGHKLLFTGDAGKTGLHYAISYAESLGIPLTDLNFLDVPHHGSKNNLNSKILLKIRAQTAFISASPNDPKHPSKKVTNALKKLRHAVYVNRSGIICHNFNSPVREGWVPVTEEPFHDKFKDD
ncbi:MAG: MBL fold metallo-hydrolase [Candidatus Shapirobacteria bacterium]